jgi:hypothetical protein
MSGGSDGKDKTLPLVMALIILGLFFLYLKKSGGVDSIKEAISVLNGGSPRPTE